MTTTPVATCEPGEISTAGGALNAAGKTCGVVASFREDERTWRISATFGAEGGGFDTQVICVAIGEDGWRSPRGRLTRRSCGWRRAPLLGTGPRRPSRRGTRGAAACAAPKRMMG